MAKYPFDKAAWRWVKDVALDKAPSINYCCYMVNEGRVTTSNGRFTCSHPITDENSYMVVGKELERVFPVMDSDEGLTLSLTERQLIITRAGFRAAMPRLKYEEWTQQKPNGNWQKLPDNFIQAIRTLRPFISDNASQAWATGICMTPEGMFATDNVSAIKYDLVCEMEAPIIIPLWVVDFILSREGVQDIEVDAKHIAFRWANGAWLTSCLIEGSYPDSVRQVIENAPPEEATCLVTPAFRAGVNAIIGLADGAVRFNAEGASIGYGNTEVQAEVTCALPEGIEQTLWPPKALLNVINVAERWAPQNWPKPAIFLGKNIKGLIVGRVK